MEYLTCRLEVELLSLSELVIAMRQQNYKLREREQELLNDIIELTDEVTAEAACDLYDYTKHAYGFEGYLYQLEKLKTALLLGIPVDYALVWVDSCLSVDAIIQAYQKAQ